MSKHKPTSPRATYTLTASQQSVVYCCGLRTIERYRSKGLPLDDPPEMWAVWGAGKNMPDGVRAKGLPAILADFEAVAGATRQRLATPPNPPATGDAEPPDTSTAHLDALPGGAEHELRSLASLAMAARRNLIRANAGSNALTKKQALDAYVKLAESLLRYDRNVDPSRRDTGEVVTRAQIQSVLTGVIVWTRRGIENFINETCLKIAECDRPEAVYTIVADSLRGCLGRAVDASLESQANAPGWVRDAMVEGL